MRSSCPPSRLSGSLSPLPCRKSPPTAGRRTLPSSNCGPNCGGSRGRRRKTRSPQPRLKQGAALQGPRPRTGAEGRAGPGPRRTETIEREGPRRVIQGGGWRGGARRKVRQVLAGGRRSHHRCRSAWSRPGSEGARESSCRGRLGPALHRSGLSRGRGLLEQHPFHGCQCRADTRVGSAAIASTGRAEPGRARAPDGRHCGPCPAHEEAAARGGEKKRNPGEPAASSAAGRRPGGGGGGAGARTHPFPRDADAAGREAEGAFRAHWGASERVGLGRTRRVELSGEREEGQLGPRRARRGRRGPCGQGPCGRERWSQ